MPMPSPLPADVSTEPADPASTASEAEPAGNASSEAAAPAAAPTAAVPDAAPADAAADPTRADASAPAAPHDDDAEPAGTPVAAAAPASGAPSPRVDPAECGRLLAERFPALFGRNPKPLKLRIQADIQAAAPGVFTKPMLSAFLRRYTGSTAYLAALSQAKQRHGLDGEPAGELSDEHRQIAAQELARRRADQQARRALADEQRRNRATLLRDFQTTRLTAANFCALKGVPVDELDGLLALARQEAEEDARRAPPDRDPRGPRADRPQRAGDRPEPSRRPQGRPGGPRREGPPGAPRGRQR